MCITIAALYTKIEKFYIISQVYHIITWTNLTTHLLVTAQDPDLVVIDRMEETMNILELTVLLETNIKNANAQKMNKYEHFITDISTRDVSVHPFEICSRGYISPSNKAILKKLHKLCKPSVSF